MRCGNDDPPSVSSAFLFDRLPPILISCVPWSILYSIGGIHLAYWTNFPISASMALVGSILFIPCCLFGPKEGTQKSNMQTGRGFHKPTIPNKKASKRRAFKCGIARIISEPRLFSLPSSWNNCSRLLRPCHRLRVCGTLKHRLCTLGYFNLFFSLSLFDGERLGIGVKADYLSIDCLADNLTKTEAAKKL